LTIHHSRSGFLAESAEDAEEKSFELIASSYEKRTWCQLGTGCFAEKAQTAEAGMHSMSFLDSRFPITSHD
jgi:hypothetical protein